MKNNNIEIIRNLTMIDGTFFLWIIGYLVAAILISWFKGD